MNKRSRPKLTLSQRIQFLKLIAQLASNTTIERKLGLDVTDIQFYKKELNVESQDDARRLYKKLEIQSIEGTEEVIIKETTLARQAEQIANERLKEIEKNKALERANKKTSVDANKIHSEDAERQKRFREEQEKALEVSEPWHLPLEGTEADRRAMIDRFRRDIEYCGMTFCVQKYQATQAQIKAEAANLKIRINWDRVKR